jgi:hypothetical protein
MDEIIRVLLDHPNAPKLNKANDATELRGLLERVRDVRNKLAHFRGELSGEERRLIMVASEWLEQNLPAPAPPSPPLPPVVPVGPPAAHPQTPTTPEIGDDDEPRGTYAALSAHLRSQSATTTSVLMTFQEIERVLGKELPRSAFDYRAWWANDPVKPQSAAWLDEGWRATVIRMTERQLTFVRTNERANAYISFFEALNTRLKQELGFPLREVLPKGASWQSLVSLNWMGRAQAACLFVTFTRNRQLRIELYLDCGNREQNERKFDEIYERKQEFEEIVGEPLSWEFRENSRACRIAVYTPARIELDAENGVLLDWAAKRAVKFYRAFAPLFIS